MLFIPSSISVQSLTYLELSFLPSYNSRNKMMHRSAWRALKPGGIMIVPFLSKDAYADKFDGAFTKQWRDMSDLVLIFQCNATSKV